MALSELRTAEEIGVVLGKHPKTVLQLFRRGELPGIKLGARTVRFDPADVQRYIDAHRTVSSGGGAG